VSDKPPAAGIVQKQQGKRGDNGATYRAELQSLQSVDDLVEGVVNALQSAGKLDNTVVIYTSDNGFLYGDHGVSGKNSFYEGSIRVPLVVRGPGIPENATRSQLVNNLDVPATIEQLAGVTPGIAPDGHTLSPLFADADAPWRSALLIEGSDDQSARARRYVAVRTATKKYVHRTDGSEELYDLAADPYELQDKAGDASYAGDLAALRDIQDRLKSCAGPSCWVP
jgi:N-acetylglucosamine-6-sulfatase